LILPIGAMLYCCLYNFPARPAGVSRPTAPLLEELPMTEADIEPVETAIRQCVAQFYRAGRADPLLGPVFESHIAEWDDHLRIIANFWSHSLLGTKRYSGAPYPVHIPMPLTPEHFARWVELFSAAATATLPAPYAEQACAKARHMGESFASGLFPFRDKDGKPSRLPT
jgi:hemoglobin